MNVSRMAQSQLHLLSLACCILTVDSQGCLTWALLHNKEYSRNCIPGSPFFSAPVLHLCPLVPMGSSGLGPTEQVQHINFSCNAESLFLHNQTPTPPHPTPYLAQSLPHPSQSQEDGSGGGPRSHIPFHLARWAVNTAQHREQQVLSLPVINYPCCITLLNAESSSPAPSYSPASTLSHLLTLC